MGALTEPLYVCVQIAHFAAQALLRLRPDASRAATAVVAGAPPLEQVCSVNTVAMRLGVVPGMTRAELDAFPGLHILRRSESEESLARAALLEAAGGFTPRIEITSCTATAFVMVLDMSGTSLLFGTIQETLKSIARVLFALRFSAQLAVSANFHAALCMAPSAVKAPAVIPAGAEAACLSSLPLAVLPLTPQQAETLSLWGLHTLGELAALPEVDLVVRLGQDGKRLRLLARGENPHLMVPEEPVFTLEEFLALDAPIELMESLLFVLGPLLDQLLIRAQNRSFALASVTVKLTLDGGGEHRRTIKPALPVLQREVLLKLLHLDLQAHPPPAGILSIFVHAEPGDRSKVQLGMFSPQLPEPLQLDVTLARIAALVGEERVGRVRLLDTHRPDSFVMERFTVPSATPKQQPGKSNAIALRRCRPPLTLSVRHNGQRLDAFFLHGKPYTVEEAFGPWRKSGEWWTAELWSIEEWDIRATCSEATLLCLITHNLLSHHWQLEALYD
jgi:protein ImuB